MLCGERCGGLSICCNQQSAKRMRHDTMISAVEGEEVQWVNDCSCIFSTQCTSIAAEPHCRQRAWVSYTVRHHNSRSH